MKRRIASSSELPATLKFLGNLLCAADESLSVGEFHGIAERPDYREALLGRLNTSPNLSQSMSANAAKSRGVLAQETIEWFDPKVQKPDMDTTIIISCADGETVPGFLTCEEGTDREVWRREYWPHPMRDLDILDVVAWAEWPAAVDKAPISKQGPAS